MQKFVASNDRLDFDQKVNELLKSGYKVVPGTLTVVLSNYEKVFMVVLE